MTSKEFGRLANTLITKARWTQADKDTVVLALRDAEERLLRKDPRNPKLLGISLPTLDELANTPVSDEFKD